MRQRRQTQKNRKNSRPAAPPQKGRPARRPVPQPKFGQMDDKYKDVPMKTVEERKAAQLERWRKELGLD